MIGKCRLCKRLFSETLNEIAFFIVVNDLEKRIREYIPVCAIHIINVFKDKNINLSISDKFTTFMLVNNYVFAKSRKWNGLKLMDSNEYYTLERKSRIQF